MPRLLPNSLVPTSVRIPILGMRDDEFPETGYHPLIENAHYDEQGAWFTSEGSIRVKALSAGQQIITLYEWTRRGNQRWLIAEYVASNTTATVAYYDWRADAFVTITTRSFDAAAPVGSTFLSIGLWLYILTPGDAPVRWNGERLEPVGFLTPPSPFASGPGGGFSAYDASAATWQSGSTGTRLRDPYVFDLTFGGSATETDPNAQRGVGPYVPEEELPEPWKKGYAITWLNAVGSESPRSGLSICTGTNSSDEDRGKRLVLVNIPPGPPEAIAGRLWATANLRGVDEPSAAPVYLVDEFLHTAGHDYIDHTPDGELVLQLDEAGLGPTPTAPPTGCYNDGYLWLVDGEDPTRVARSAELLQEQFPPESFFTVGSAATGQVVAIVPFQRSVVVFKTNGIFAITADAAPRVLSESHGTDAPKAIVVVPDEGIFYLDRIAGPSVVYGTMQDDQTTGIRPLPGIRKTWRRLVSKRLESARVLYDPENREVWWSVPTGGGSRNDANFVFHLPVKGWSLRPGWTVDSMVRSHTGHVLVGTNTSGTPGLEILSYGSAVRAGFSDSVALRLVSSWQDVDSSTQYSAVELVADAYGTPGVTVSTRADRRPTDISQTETAARELVHADHDRETWGSALWGSALLWTEYEPARVVVDLADRANAYSYQVRLLGSRLRLYRMTLLTTDDSALPYRRERPGGSLP